MIWILLIVLSLMALVILCGYTNIRFAPGRKEGKLHVACVGDSVTYGCTLPLFFLRRYPAVLQKLLGSGTQVAAFGVNDRTLQNNGDKPYRKEKAFRQSKEYLPDCVVILLGKKRFQGLQLDFRGCVSEAVQGTDRRVPGTFPAPAYPDLYTALCLQSNQPVLLYHE